MFETVREPPSPAPHDTRPRRWLVALWLGLACLAILASLAAIPLAWPALLFSYRFDGGAVVVHSDRPIPPEISEVIGDVERRLASSELPAAGPYQVYLCNDVWKLAYFGHRLSTGFGGVTDVYLTRNIFIRPADIRTNAVLPPASWRFSLADRPLSYFIAHEIAHVQQVAALGRLSYFKAPTWLLEGYADHVGKGGEFDLSRSVDALRQASPEMDPHLGLYKRYQLAVEIALRQHSFRELASDPPDLSAVLREATDGGG